MFYCGQKDSGTFDKLWNVQGNWDKIALIHARGASQVGHQLLVRYFLWSYLNLVDLQSSYERLNSFLFSWRTLGIRVLATAWSWRCFLEIFLHLRIHSLLPGRVWHQSQRLLTIWSNGCLMRNGKYENDRRSFLVFRHNPSSLTRYRMYERRFEFSGSITTPWPFLSSEQRQQRAAETAKRKKHTRCANCSECGH